MIDDFIMIIKAFMESIIVRRRRSRSRYIAGALACTLGENPSAEPVMLRLIIIAKPLFNSIIYLVLAKIKFYHPQSHDALSNPVSYLNQIKHLFDNNNPLDIRFSHRAEN